MLDLSKEKNCSLNSNRTMVIISGNIKRPDDRGLVAAGAITIDFYRWLTEKKHLRSFHIDHGNNHKKTKDRNGRTWQASPACWLYKDGKREKHLFLSTLYKEYMADEEWHGEAR